MGGTWKPFLRVYADSLADSLASPRSRPQTKNGLAGTHPKNGPFKFLAGNECRYLATLLGICGGWGSRNMPTKLTRSGRSHLVIEMSPFRTPRRSGPKRLGSEPRGTALTAPSFSQAFAAVPHPRLGASVLPVGRVLSQPLPPRSSFQAARTAQTHLQKT